LQSARNGPADISSPDKRASPGVSGKIIYDRDDRPGNPDWYDVFKPAVYAINNTVKIKKGASTEHTAVYTNSPNLPLVILDTAAV
jgi:hypothetical protein